MRTISRIARRPAKALWIVCIWWGVAACNLSDPIASDPDTGSTSGANPDVSPPRDARTTDGDGGFDGDGCLPSLESCDGGFNECDGTDAGSCRCDYEGASTGVCGNGVIDDSGTCQPPDDYISADSEAPDHCDGRDNDCDGTTDEGCTCSSGNTQSCYSGPSGTDGVGICTSGQQTCTDDETWGECTGDVLPEDGEVCGNAEDEDCDGTVGEGCPCDYDGNADGICVDQTRQPDGTCPKPEQFESEESSCDDGLDNDCDGATDFDDADCKKPAGASCDDDGECRASCVAVGEQKRCAHRAFVTSTRLKGGIGGLSAADAECDQRAGDAGLAGEFEAVLSTNSTSARDRIALEAPLFDLNGSKIADGASDLWDGSLDHPIELDEDGDPITGNVWTGTEPSGDLVASGATCRDWTQNGAVASGSVGSPTATDSAWVDAGRSAGCNDNNHLYCIEQ